MAQILELFYQVLKQPPKNALVRNYKHARNKQKLKSLSKKMENMKNKMNILDLKNNLCVH